MFVRHRHFWVKCIYNKTTYDKPKAKEHKENSLLIKLYKMKNFSMESY